MGKQDEKATKSKFSLHEEEMIATWKKENSFEATVKNREGKETFTFYDGPPFANGLPHYGHLMTSVVKDAVPRYKTMQGYHVPRRFGWDCHGLPAEMKAEKDLGVSGRKAISTYGIDKFNDYCRSSVLEFTKEWEQYVERLGRWVDFSDNYHTMDQDYMESVIWAFKQLHGKGLVYEDLRVMPYSYGAQTPLSNFETRLDDAYRDREDETATVKFKLENGMTILVWTTTPWTLPSNLALAVNETMDYAVLDSGEELLVVAPEAIERYEELQELKEVKRIKGKELVGLSYTPLMDYFKDLGGDHFKVWHGEFVTAEEGTGTVHIAPGFGEDDFNLGRNAGLETVCPVNDAGEFTEEVPDYVDKLVFDANPLIIADLKKAGKLFATDVYLHKYPHCWRTDTPIIYRALSGWFVSIDKIKDDLIRNNQKINWIPENVKDGAFGKWLENARDWSISRNRFWGAPIPVWRTEDGSETVVVGSIEELKELADDPDKVTDLHRPYIDDVVITTKSGKKATRVTDVLDCWFESGSMPFAQVHAPFENEEWFNDNNPADFIVEYNGQIRGWFYTLHVLATALFNKPAYNNVIAHGVILGTDNRKMSKRLGNYPPLTEVLDKYGADVLRYYILTNPVLQGETVALDEQALVDIQRNVFLRLNNVYSFFSMYSEIDDWQRPSKVTAPDTDNVLDLWILSRLNETIKEVEEQADKYELVKAVRPLRGFIDDLSNWYVRRNRRRFWKSEDDQDKNTAYHTLWFVLVQLSKTLAPWSPFMSDKLYRDLMNDSAESVHVTDWPKAGKIDNELLETMSHVRDVINHALSARAEASIKVRQPLSQVTVYDLQLDDPLLEEIIAEEVNVKNVVIEKTGNTFKGITPDSVVLNTELTEDLRLEGHMRDIVRRVQNARKKAGLNVEDRIALTLKTEDPELKKTILQHTDTIKSETLSTTLNNNSNYSHSEVVKIATKELTIELEKNE